MNEESPTEIPTIKVCEENRFLNWQDKKSDLEEWENWFTARKIPYKRVRAAEGWTIYKKMELYRE